MLVQTLEPASPSAEGAHMSRIMVLGFGDDASAEAFRSTLQDMVDTGALQVEDAVKVSIAADGSSTITHYSSVVRGGALVGGALGGVVGLFLLNPVAGAAIGAAGGAALGKLTGDYGLEEDFIKETSETLKPGTTALFVQAKRMDDFESVEAAIEDAGATVVATGLNREAEDLRADMLAGPEPEGESAEGS
jgi:uncharacterized membrane protein